VHISHISTDAKDSQSPISSVSNFSDLNIVNILVMGIRVDDSTDTGPDILTPTTPVLLSG
jgi:hypothetical protein